MDIQKLEQELESVYEDLQKQKEVLDNIARLGGFEGQELQHADGSYPYVEVLTSSVQVLSALMEVKKMTSVNDDQLKTSLHMSSHIHDYESMMSKFTRAEMSTYKLTGLRSYVTCPTCLNFLGGGSNA